LAYFLPSDLRGDEPHAPQSHSYFPLEQLVARLQEVDAFGLGAALLIDHEDCDNLSFHPGHSERFGITRRTPAREKPNLLIYLLCPKNTIWRRNRE